MKNSREKFEEWLSNYELQPNARLGEEELDLMLDAWQAATEQSQKEIAELEAKLNELVKFQSSADRLAKAQAESLNTIAELKAREKELVEALEKIAYDEVKVSVTMTKTEIINGLRQLSVDMVEIGTAIDYYYGLNPLSQHGKEMVGAGKIAEEWANEMEKENDR